MLRNTNALNFNIPGNYLHLLKDIYALLKFTILSFVLTLDLLMILLYLKTGDNAKSETTKNHLTGFFLQLYTLVFVAVPFSQTAALPLFFLNDDRD
jgi:hypothetical protein